MFAPLLIADDDAELKSLFGLLLASVEVVGSIFFAIFIVVEALIDVIFMFGIREGKKGENSLYSYYSSTGFKNKK
jgi:hypothetical protein